MIVHYTDTLQLTLKGRLTCFDGHLTIDNGDPLGEILGKMLKSKYIGNAKVRIVISEGHDDEAV